MHGRHPVWLRGVKQRDIGYSVLRNKGMAMAFKNERYCLCRLLNPPGCRPTLIRKGPSGTHIL